MHSASFSEIIEKNLLQLDVEFGNAEGFFSASKTDLQASIIKKNDKFSNYDAGICGANLSIGDLIDVKSNGLIRNVQFVPMRDSKLFDLVSRFVVISNDRCARIAGNEVKHTCKNIYHQYKTDDVIVPVGTDNYLKFQGQNSKGHPSFETVFYIRDEGIEKDGMKRWIVHHRIIVDQNAANLIVRSCNPVLEGPLPMQWMIPALIKRKLFRIRERKLPNFPLMTVGEVLVKKYHTFNICTSVEFLNG